MKIIKLNSTSDFDKYNLNVAIGNFDGVHIGHQEIIKKLIDESNNLNLKSAVLSFVPHPRQFFTNNFDDFSIISENEKIKILSELNIDYYIPIKFDNFLASYTPKQFVEEVLYNKLNVKNIIVGSDFRFGKDRKGNIDLLKSLSNIYEFKVSVMEQIINKQNSMAYSSSFIRKNIKDGNFEDVNLMLGRNWIMDGKVIYGNKKASKMNFPTANILPQHLIKPKKGVYAIRAKLINSFYDGIANFGVRPTIDGKKLLLEAHIFEFNQEIYGKDLTVEFLTFIREEKKFEDFSSLTKQIQKDIQIAKEYHLNKNGI